ncbi:IS481 family transposase [Guyparkeria halophila]|uniref:IS481 family transposase n=2 Tax=Guyparkeria TaxID=2035712 RepID=A0A6I6D405_9GAMM|nr:IS481 family transposase [Guyparkeria halophila]QGT78693.1 IS481 family transposase [Guyparkeria halophila]
MDIHQNAALTPRGRARLVNRVLASGWSFRATARAFEVDPKTVRRWVARYRHEGLSGLRDRRSRPKRQPRRTPGRLNKQVVALRHRRWTLSRIGAFTGLSRATVGRILQRNGLNRLASLEPKEPPRRYEHESPGDLLHLDIKKLARFRQPGHRVTGFRTKGSMGAGWEFVHVAIDDRSRLAFTQIHPDEGKRSAIAHLKAAVAYYASLGITIRRVLTDNGPCYRSKSFANACQELGIRHRFTQPYRPRTNGKAERFIQTAMREWAYAFSYRNAEERAQHLPRWLHDYNWHRQHGSLDHKPPISVLGLPEDNLMRLHI